MTNWSGGTVEGVAHGVFIRAGPARRSNAGHIDGAAASGKWSRSQWRRDGEPYGEDQRRQPGCLDCCWRRRSDELGRDIGTESRRRRPRRRRHRRQCKRRVDQRRELRRYIGDGSAATDLLTNAQGIDGTGTSGRASFPGPGGAVTNQSGGTISGVGAGVYMKGGPAP